MELTRSHRSCQLRYTNVSSRMDSAVAQASARRRFMMLSGSPALQKHGASSEAEQEGVEEGYTALVQTCSTTIPMHENSSRSKLQCV